MSPKDLALLFLTSCACVGIGGCASDAHDSPQRPVTASSAAAGASTVTTTSASAQQQEVLIDPDVIGVVLVAKPAALQTDGDLSEWGSMNLDPEQVDDPDRHSLDWAAKRRYGDDWPSIYKSWNAEWPAEAEGMDPGQLPETPIKPPVGSLPASIVALAIEQDGVHVAARLRGNAKQGFRLRIGADIPLPPSVGNGTASSGVAHGFDCESAHGWASEQPTPLTPTQSLSCQKAKARDFELNLAFGADYTRTIIFEPAGVFLLGSDASDKVAINAKVAWVPNADGADVELTLPLSVLPYLSSAPVEVLRLGAAPDARPAPWAWLKLVKPFELSPQSKLRNLWFHYQQDTHQSWPSDPCFSYSPSTPDRVRYFRDIDPESRAHLGANIEIELVQADLYKKLDDFGTMEIGWMPGPGPVIVVTDGDKLTAYPPVRNDTDLMQFTIEYSGRRGLDYAVATYGAPFMTREFFRPSPAWWVLTIHPDGTTQQHQLPLLAAVSNSFVQDSRDCKPSTNADATKLTLDCTYKHQHYGATWKWDAAEGDYIVLTSSRPRP
ncbi:MAG: hypothetical protein U0271_26985 [Polyangiaceae bacterium]